MEFTIEEKQALRKVVSTKYNYWLNQKNSAYLETLLSPTDERTKQRLSSCEVNCLLYDGLLIKVCKL